MIFFYLSLLSLTAMTFISGSNGFICDEDCADKPVFSPPSLVVQYGHSASVRCTACQQACQHEHTGMNISVGQPKKDGNLMLWKTEELLEWDVSATCYNTDHNGTRCCSHLPVTVYTSPRFIFLYLTEVIEDTPERTRYEVECSVIDAAPLENTVVTFYKEKNHTVQTLGELKSKHSSRTPASEVFTLFVPKLPDDNSLYWCEAKLDLGPEGPQPPVVFTSEKVHSHMRMTMSSSSKLNVSFTLCFMLLLFSLI
uniref:Ig-like domain-containing protein n=1 Tax=Salarias fasciatus TaxID=181472 RepID=A0A672GA40_SALFA